MNPRPIVAVVGRPNVGKSSLFNRLVGKPLAIVHDEPGVTRDRHYADVWAFGRSYVLIDTGGFELDREDPMGERIREQVALAVSEADVVVCVFDATGVTDADREAVGMLRRADKPVVYAANKADSKRVEDEALDLYRLGIPKVFPISALHGRGIGELETAIVAALPPAPPEEEHRDEEEIDEAAPRPRGPIRIALVGRPNAGKSSLANRIVGEERVLVDEQPGTTRDAIDIPVEKKGRAMLLVDTAGIRRKGKVAKEASELEGASVFQASGSRRTGREDPRPRRRSGARGRHRRQQDRSARRRGAQIARGKDARQAELRSLGADRAHLREDGARRRHAPRNGAPSGRRLPSARPDRPIEPLLRNRPLDAPASDDGQPRSAPLLHHASRIVAPALRRHDQRARAHPLQLPALPHEPASQGLRLRGCAAQGRL